MANKRHELAEAYLNHRVELARSDADRRIQKMIEERDKVVSRQAIAHKRGVEIGAPFLHLFLKRVTMPFSLSCDKGCCTLVRAL